MLPTELIIDRVRWCRGKGSKTQICDDSGNLDCLGFLLVACGMDRRDLIGVWEPIDLPANHQDLLSELGLIECRGLVRWQTSICMSVIAVNDIPGLDQSREARLTRLFQQLKIQLRFEG